MHLSRQPEGESLQAHLLWYVKDDLLATYKSSTLFLVRLLTGDNVYSPHKCSQSTGTFAVSISLFIRGSPSSSTCFKTGKIAKTSFPPHRNFAKCTRNLRSARKMPNQRRAQTATESRSKAIAPSASWNSSPRRKKLSGAAPVAGITSTRPVLNSGHVPSERREFAAFIGKVQWAFFILA